MPVEFLYDDAYITLASAEALLRGADPHYPDATALTGITSPFHVVLTALLAALLPGPTALVAGCLMGGAVYAAGIAQVARHAGLLPRHQFALVVAGLGTGMVSHHFVNGLETSWAMAAIIWSWHFATSSRRTALAITCGVLPFVRPELGLWALVLAARDIREHRTARVWGLAALSALPWLVLAWSYTGLIWPTTLAAKRDWYAEGCWTIADRVRTVGSGLGLWLFISAGLLPGIVGLTRSAVGRLALGTAAAMIVVWASQLPSLLYGYHRHRYYAPLLAFMVAGYCSLPDPWRRRLCWVTASAALVTTSPILSHEPGRIAVAVRDRQEVVAVLEHARAERVIIHDAGYLAWADAAPVFIDMVGLKTRGAAALNRELTGPSCGARRPEALDRLARETRATHVLTWEPWDQAFGVTRGLVARGWRVVESGRTSSVEPIILYALEPPP
jgi:hypothetical protein